MVPAAPFGGLNVTLHSGQVHFTAAMIGTSLLE
jgi:hypothetical protein